MGGISPLYHELPSSKVNGSLKLKMDDGEVEKTTKARRPVSGNCDSIRSANAFRQWRNMSALMLLETSQEKSNKKKSLLRNLPRMTARSSWDEYWQYSPTIKCTQSSVGEIVGITVGT